MTFISRILGFGRDVVLAVMFGAGPAMDAFLVAFKIPNFLRRLFAEGAFAQSFVPVLSATRDQESGDEVKALVSVVAGTLGVILMALTAVGVIAAPLLIYLFAPGFAENAAQFDLAVDLLRLTFPYLFFISLTALAGGVLNTYGRFAVPAVTPVLLNICLIGAAALLSPHFSEPTIGLAIGVFVGVLLSALFFANKVGRLLYITSHLVEGDRRRVYEVTGQVFFASATTFRHHFDFHEALPAVTIDVHRAHFWDISAVEALDRVVMRLRRDGTEVDVVGLNEASRTLVDKVAVHDKPDAEKLLEGH